LSFPFIIWTEPRTAGTALSAALKSISEHPSVEDEPFQYGPNPKALGHVYEDWCLDGDPAPLYRVLARRVLIKHIPEAFDDNFNADLSRAAEYNGYRHIRLVRLDTFARLVSRGVAEQLDAWGTHADARLGDLRPGDLRPLDVPHLVGDARVDARRWQAVLPHLTAVLNVRTEDLVSRFVSRRHARLRRVLRFLALPPEGLGALDRAMARGGQDTSRVWPLVPNLGELRDALARECVA
jgi:hypothetical protein